MSVFAFFIFLLQFPVGFLLTSYVDREKRLTKAESFFATLILGPTAICFIWAANYTVLFSLRYVSFIIN